MVHSLTLNRRLMKYGLERSILCESICHQSTLLILISHQLGNQRLEQTGKTPDATFWYNNSAHLTFFVVAARFQSS